MYKSCLEWFSYGDLEENYKRLSTSVSELQFCLESYENENLELHSTNEMLSSTIDGIKIANRRPKMLRRLSLTSIISTEMSDVSYSEKSSNVDLEIRSKTPKITLIEAKRTPRAIRKSKKETPRFSLDSEINEARVRKIDRRAKTVKSINLTEFN